jgi:DNA-binding IclR family transcriptional regulator
VSIAVSALDCFAASRELGATQVARELGVAKSTACRALSALAAGGLLERVGGGRYRLSLRVFELGLLAAERMPVRDIARPALMELEEQLREMVQLGVPVGGYVVYIDRYLGGRADRPYSRPAEGFHRGERVPGGRPGQLAAGPGIGGLVHAAQHRTHPEHARRQPGPAARPA